MKDDCPIDKFTPAKSREDNKGRLGVRNSGKFSFPITKTRSVQKLLFTVVVLTFYLSMATRSFSRQLTTTEQLCIDDYDN